MGAYNIAVSMSAKNLSMAEAYARLVDEALYEEGHNPYNGTISTTKGFVDTTKQLQAFDNDIDKWEEWALDNTTKWGSAYGAKTAEDMYFFVGWGAA